MIRAHDTTPFTRGDVSLPALTPAHSPCPLARPEGEKRLGHYLSATARMGAGIAPFPPPLLGSLAVFVAGRALC